MPADNKWFTRIVVAAAVVKALEDLDLRYPVVDEAKKKELAAARRQLEGQNGKEEEEMTDKKKGFFATHLDPGGIFGEILFGLIMVLTFTLGAGLTAEDGPEGVRSC